MTYERSIKSINSSIIMKLKTLIITAISVVFTAAVVLFSIGYYGNSQSMVNRHLLAACGSGNAYTATYWLAKGADVNATSNPISPDESPLFNCAHLGDKDLVEMLLELGADPNFTAVGFLGHTPLHQASTASIADTLVIYGADINKKNNEGLTPLQYRMRPNTIGNDDPELLTALQGNGPRAKVREEARKMVEDERKAWEAKKASEKGK